MKPKLTHQEAMNYSFKAKQALDLGQFSEAIDLFQKAAELESQVAEFYFDKTDLEPTRSIIIRSAAFLNLKAGLISNAQKFIFYGLLNIKDELIKSQLNDALEISVSLQNLSTESAANEFNYLTLLRQRSIHYVLEPSNSFYGHSVSLEMIKDFANGYIKSLKAYSISHFKKIIKFDADKAEQVIKEIGNLINPLVTASGYGSFKFSIANDFLPREGEIDEVIKLKSSIISNYHSEIFINPLSDIDISVIKQKYDEDEINEIFRPLTKLKSNNSPYKVGYYDTDTYNKVYVSKIVNKQKKQLLTAKQITQEDIGSLENSIIHKRNSSSGKILKKTIIKEQLKSFEIEIKTNQLEPNNHNPILLTEEIFITMNFNSDTGFTFSFDDFSVQNTDITYEKALKGFYDIFLKKIQYIINKQSINEQEEKEWNSIKKLFGNTDSFKNVP